MGIALVVATMLIFMLLPIGSLFADPVGCITINKELLGPLPDEGVFTFTFNLFDDPEWHFGSPNVYIAIDVSQTNKGSITVCWAALIPGSEAWVGEQKTDGWLSVTPGLLPDANEQNWGRLGPITVVAEGETPNSVTFINTPVIELAEDKATDKAKEPAPWARERQMTCFQVWVNEDNNFEFVFWWEYKNNNWVKIYDMEGAEVFAIDMKYGNAKFETDLPDGMYTVKTFHKGFEKPIQEFIIGKP